MPRNSKVSESGPSFRVKVAQTNFFTPLQPSQPKAQIKPRKTSMEIATLLDVSTPFTQRLSALRIIGNALHKSSGCTTDNHLPNVERLLRTLFGTFSIHFHNSGRMPNADLTGIPAANLADDTA